MNLIKFIVLSFLITLFSGCNYFQNDMESYSVDDYKIIEISYFNSIDQELLAKFQAEETDKEVLELIKNEDYLSAYYKSNGMCYVLPDNASDGGYRMLNNEDNRYLEVSNNFSDKYGHEKKGIYDGQNTYCTVEKFEESRPAADAPIMAYELADLFMSETEIEITDNKKLEKYMKELSNTFTENSKEKYMSTFHSIKFYDSGTTRLVRIHEEWYDGESHGEGIAYIQITLSNDVDKFNEIYDDVYEETLMRKEQVDFKNFCGNK